MDEKPPRHETTAPVQVSTRRPASLAFGTSTVEAAEAAVLEQRVRDAERLYISFKEAAGQLGLIFMQPP
jgi:hypothetical protein